MNSEYRNIIEDKLLRTGEKDKLKEQLRQRLVECGWKEQIKLLLKERIKELGISKVTVDDLITDITPKGRALVPEQVRLELLNKIRKFLQDHEGV